jgi:carbon storage regulator CsrA
MLILSRRRNEAIFIGEDIKIVIFDHGASYVKVGIEAPRSLPINRGVFDTLTGSCIKESEQNKKSSIISRWFRKD